jgi:hypothetical protein
MFEWYVVWCGSNNGYQKEMCLKRLDLVPINMIIVLDSIVYIFGGHIRDTFMHTLDNYQNRCS